MVNELLCFGLAIAYCRYSRAFNPSRSDWIHRADSEKLRRVRPFCKDMIRVCRRCTFASMSTFQLLVSQLFEPISFCQSRCQLCPTDSILENPSLLCLRFTNISPPKRLKLADGNKTCWIQVADLIPPEKPLIHEDHISVSAKAQRGMNSIRGPPPLFSYLREDERGGGPRVSSQAIGPVVGSDKHPCMPRSRTAKLPRMNEMPTTRLSSDWMQCSQLSYPYPLWIGWSIGEWIIAAWSRDQDGTLLLVVADLRACRDLIDHYDLSND